MIYSQIIDNELYITFEKFLLYFGMLNTEVPGSTPEYITGVNCTKPMCVKKQVSVFNDPEKHIKYLIIIL